MKDIGDLRIDWGDDIKKMEASMASAQRQLTDGALWKLPQVGDTLGSFKIHSKIGQGSFGAVFEGQAAGGGPRVAIKVETCSPDARYSQLQNEFETYRNLEGISGFPKIHYFGRDGSMCYLVMDVLGISLEEMLGVRNRRFCAKTVFILTKRMVDLVEKLHRTGRIHRDLKPDNFLIGEDPKDLFLVDFGMTKKFLKKDKHIPHATGKRLTGTPRYASINAHKGFELSRRDDLESIGYIIVYLTKGCLPWQGIKENNKSKCRLIGERKEQTSIRELCGDIPSGDRVHEYFEYVRGLNFEDAPNYEYLKNIFDRALSEHGLFDDGALEWEYVFRNSVDHGDRDSFGSLGQRPRKKGMLKKLLRTFTQCFKRKDAQYTN